MPRPPKNQSGDTGEPPASANAQPSRRSAGAKGKKQSGGGRKKNEGGGSRLAAIGEAASRMTSPEPSDEEIRLRAYFIAERRFQLGLPGDSDSDWIEAKRQLLEETARK